MVHADEEPAGVRDDETDEADRPGDGGGRSAEQYGAEGGHRPGHGDPFSEPGRQLVSQGERVEGAGGEQADGEADGEERRDLADAFEGRAADAADLPELEASGDVVARQDDRADERGEGGRCGGSGERELERGGPSLPSVPTV